MAGRTLANIIQMGKGSTDPRGFITQPLFSGEVTLNPLGTLSFCNRHENGQPWCLLERLGLQGPRMVGYHSVTYLSVSVRYTEVNQDHDKNGNWNSEISDDATALKPRITHKPV